MSTKNGRVDQHSHFRDDSGQQWNLTEDHQGVGTFTPMNLDEYQGQEVLVEYEIEHENWLLQVSSITAS